MLFAYAVSGASAYAFLVIAARSLGRTAYASLSSFWLLVFLIVPGLLLPLEQEIGRVLAVRSSRGDGGRPVVVRAGSLGLVAVVVVLGAIGSGQGRLLADLLDGREILLTALGLALLGYLAQTLVRSTCSGNGRFDLYSRLVITEGAARLLLALPLAAFHVRDVVLYAFAVGVAPWVAVLLVLPRVLRLLAPGTPARWAELSSALGWLLAGAFVSNVLLNVGPLGVKASATHDQQALAGEFLACVVLTRIPLFLFQAVQAILLPGLAPLAAAGEVLKLRLAVRRATAGVALVAALSVAAAAVIGPWAVSIFFGRGSQAMTASLIVLSLGSGAYMLALTLAQAAIAMRGHRLVSVAWCVGLAAALAVMAAPLGLLSRGAYGFFAGAMTAAVGMGVVCSVRLRELSSSSAQSSPEISAPGHRPLGSLSPTVVAVVAERPQTPVARSWMEERSWQAH
jgi:O-antigen/teichoic acid export membrane protein